MMTNTMHTRSLTYSDMGDAAQCLARPPLFLFADAPRRRRRLTAAEIRARKLRPPGEKFRCLRASEILITCSYIRH